jgi:1-acyl-sn-glycerol-3-phosphate acyltransferase
MPEMPDLPHATAPPGGLLRLAYAFWAWTVFLALGATAMLLLLLIPSLVGRRRCARAFARVVFVLVGVRLRVQGLTTLRPPCIVVANHASYLDGIVLAASLPPDFGFVIKREMAAVPLAGTLLRRIGAEFVERQNRARSTRDTRRLLRRAERGQSLVFFPEGTFSEQIGLLRFHIGAFAAAARAELPVVPLAIRGTRRCLPANSMLPWPGTIEVTVLAPLPSEDAACKAPKADRATRLRDQARAALLAALGEPDLEQCEQRPGVAGA